MPRLPHKYRSLYLLALFQLVGGPLVLLPVILFSKLGVKEVAAHGFTKGLSQAWHGAGWQSAMEAVLQGDVGLPSTEKDKTPQRTKDAKEKLFATELERPMSAPIRDVVERVPWKPGDVFALARTQAPPGPPPRWV
jgi:hypothetical protein